MILTDSSIIINVIIAASKYEIQNLSLPEYDYRPEHLKLTGVPRYDGLVNKDQRQILITPTWRSYIADAVCYGKIQTI